MDDLDLSEVHLHGVRLDRVRMTDGSLRGADISGDIEGLTLNGVAVAAFVEAELDRQQPGRALLRSTDVAGLRAAWSTVEGLWAETTSRALALPQAVQRRRVGDEWSFVETLRHLVFATDCWILRAVRLEPHPYHPWGLPWSGAGPGFALAVGLDPSSAPSLEEILPIRRSRQNAVAKTLGGLSDDGLAEPRVAPDSPGHPNGVHTVLQCLHVLLNEEWQHHRYAVRDLDVLDPPGPSGSEEARS